jgi:thymidylate synthase (FAD)
LRNQHWSVFESVHMTVEIETSRAISAQIMRHRSFTFQEFSQRYAEAPPSFVFMDTPRKQSKRNRQSSGESLDGELSERFRLLQENGWERARSDYEELLEMGVCREQARMLLPMATTTTFAMTGCVRSWVHYLQLRLDPMTQEEHRDIAEEIAKVFEEVFPHTWKAFRNPPSC